ncbi:MAG: NHL repeat-containing protein [Candidatus Eremiobacteraeota bacterium]|nr:NHL repeat-containing protein [Candidatus Eremiobacteraeota bacterium]
MRRSIAVSWVALFLAGCGGGSSLPNAVPLGSLQQVSSQASKMRDGSARLTVTVHVSRGERAKGVLFTAVGPATFRAVAALHAGTDVAIVLHARPGSYLGTLITYDRAPESGAFPPRARVVARVTNVPFEVAAKRANVAPFVTGGVVHSLFFIDIPGTVAGISLPTPRRFYLTAKNAAGAFIVGAYSAPITITSSDTSGATTITTGGTDNPPAGKLLSSGDSLQLTYTGLAIVPATITASATGAPSAKILFAPALSPVVTTPQAIAISGVYGPQSAVTVTASEFGWTNAPYDKKLSAALSPACASLTTVAPASGTVFKVTAKSNAPLSGSCALTVSDGAGQKAVVPISLQAGALYVTHGNSIERFNPDGTTSTLGSFSHLSGLTIDPHGNLYAADSFGLYEVNPTTGAQAKISTDPNVISMSVDASGNVYYATNAGSVKVLSNTGVLSTIATGLGTGVLEGMAVDYHGNLYVSDHTDNKILQIARNGTVVTIPGTYSGPKGMVFDPAGDLFVANATSGEVDEYTRPFGTGKKIGASVTDAYALAADAQGDLYVSEFYPGNVVEITPPFSSPNYGTSVTLATGLQDVDVGIAISFGDQPFVLRKGGK